MISPGKLVGSGLFTILFLLVAIAAGVYLVQQSQEITSRASSTPNISLEPSNTSPMVGEHIAIGVHVDSILEPIGYISLSFTYNPQQLEVVSLIPGDFITNAVIDTSTYDNQMGTASIILKNPPNTTLSIGQGQAAIAVVRPKQNGGLSISTTQQHVSRTSQDVSIITSPTSITLNAK